MKISASKVLALGGLCALFVGAGNVAFAQDYDHGQNNRNWQHDQHQNWQHDQTQYRHDDGRDSQYRQSSQYRHANLTERRRLDRLHVAYAHAAAHGNYSAAERAHLHAQAIRAQLHDQRRDNHQDRHDTN